MLLFNYRGVGRSEGKPRTGWDLVKDGAAAVAHLRRQGVAAEHILLHGHSMGGGAAAIIREQEAAAGRATGPIVNDRSFASLPAVVSAMARGVST